MMPGLNERVKNVLESTRQLTWYHRTNSSGSGLLKKPPTSAANPKKCLVNLKKQIDKPPRA